MRAVWKDAVVPKPYLREFQDDVVRVARNRELGVTIERIAKDFGIYTMTVQEWLQRAAVDDSSKPGQSRTEGGELREARTCIRLLEQQNEVLRRATANLSQAILARKDSRPLVTEPPSRGSR